MNQVRLSVLTSCSTFPFANVCARILPPQNGVGISQESCLGVDELHTGSDKSSQICVLAKGWRREA